MSLLGLFDCFDKYKSISTERINDFLTRRCIEHQCTELHRIEFRLEDWSWDLCIGDNYFKINLVFPIVRENDTDKLINAQVATDACLEVTKLLKVLKVNYSSHEYIDKENDNKLIKYNILLFSFESFCYNMCDFGKLFYDAISVIISGYHEYHKRYDSIESKLPITPIGFRQFDSDEANEKTQISNKHHVGFV